jgi:hypothetical protein
MAQIDKHCLVHTAGYNANGEAVFELEAQDNGFGRTWFTRQPDPAHPDTTRALLAVALAAITTGKTVLAVIDDPAAGSARGISAILLVA